MNEMEKTVKVNNLSEIFVHISKKSKGDNKFV